jgi:hypothetical protein
MAQRGRASCIGARDACAGLRLSGAAERLDWRAGSGPWRPRGSEKPMRSLEFGWYLPTHGDTTAYGLPKAKVPGSPELCERAAAEAAGFEYLQIPVGSTGDPVRCVPMLQEFIDAGCHSFCLSGYLHDEEAERFGRLVRPILAADNRGRLAA